MARRFLRAAAPLFLFVLPALANKSDFFFYPPNSQQCLSDAADKSNCASADNECLCTNGGGFVINAATCIGKNDPDDVRGVWEAMAGACSDSNTPLTISQKNFVDAANGDGPTSTSAAPTSTTTSASKTSKPSKTAVTTVTAQPSDDANDDGSSGLSTGATIGIGVGAGVAGAAAVAALAFWLIRRKRRTGEESHPMLGRNSQYGGATTFPPTDPSTGNGRFSPELKPGWQAQSPSVTGLSSNTPNAPRESRLSNWSSPEQQQRQSWNAHDQGRHQHYAGPYATPADPAELPPQEAPRGSHVFELDAMAPPAPAVGRYQHPSNVAEMRGSYAQRQNAYNPPQPTTYIPPEQLGRGQGVP